MIWFTRGVVVTVVLLSCEISAQAVSPVVSDSGSFFKPATIRKVNDVLSEIFRKHGKDLLVETFRTLPVSDSDKEKFKKMSKDDQATYFTKLAQKRIETRAVKGVYIFICRNPRYLKIVDSENSGLTTDDVEKLNKTVRPLFNKGRFDEGLLAAVKLIQESLNKEKKE